MGELQHTPAFPGPGPRIGIDETHGFGIFADPVPGMTMRQWYAGQALAGICSTLHGPSPLLVDVIASDAFAIADAMLAATTPNTRMEAGGEGVGV